MTRTPRNEARSKTIRIGDCRRAVCNLVTLDFRTRQIEENDVVIVELANLQAAIAEIGRITNQVLFCQSHLNTDGSARIGISKF